MRATLFYGLTATLPAALAQEGVQLKSNETSLGNVEELDGFTNGKVVAGDEPELTGADINIEFSQTKKYDIDEKGNLVMPRNGRRYGLYPDMYLRSISVDKGPCTLVYKNMSESEPPPPEGYEDFEETQEMEFGEEGGEVEFLDEHFKKTMKYIWCGEEDAGEDEDDDDDDGGEAACKDIPKGADAVDKAHVCCLPPTEWRDELWDELDMDTYLRDAIDHFNEEGWPSNVMNTFSTYDLEAYRKVTELEADDKGRQLPFWEWNCGGINDNTCFSKDLSDWDACRADPRRRLLLQAMENFSSRWQAAQTQFSQEALTKMVMVLPNLTKTLFPLEGEKPGFDAPGDYKDNTWMMIAGSIMGVLGLPFSYGGPNTVKGMPKAPTHAATVSAVLSAVLFIAGMGIGPTLEEPFVEEDPHFEKFGDFSEDLAKNFVEWVYKGYSDIYDTYYHTPSGQAPPETVDADSLGDLLSEGKLIRPWSSLPKTIDNQMQGEMTNRFLSPIVNLAWQRNKVILVKMPAGGIDFWMHKEIDNTRTLRHSATWDPCGEHPGSHGWRESYRTAERKPEEAKWIEFGAKERAVCNEDGSGYAFFVWNYQTDSAWADVGWNEMENRGLYREDVVAKSVESQDKFGFFGMPRNLTERISDMAHASGSVINDPKAWDFWNLAICDMTGYNDEGENLVEVEGCELDEDSKVKGAGLRIGPTCINYGIRNRCSKNMKDKNGDRWPYPLDDDEEDDYD